MDMRNGPPDAQSPESLFATISSGVSIPYVDAGSGDALLFVHGSLCDYRYWDEQINPLSAEFHCIAPSLSHYWPATEASIRGDFSLETHVAELAEFISALGLESVHLVGHSRGGSVAFNLARCYPRLVRTLTLADPAGPLQIDETVDSALPAATNALRAKVSDLIEASETEAGLELFVDSVSRPGSWKKSSSSFRTMAIDNARTLPLQFRDPLPAYSRDTAADVKCRTLLIDGQNSPRMFRNNVDRLAEWLYLTDRQTIAGASHGMNVANPRAFNKLLRSFILFE
ncbi:pimeloyl-ACP methyl ester carboxylesterase [Paraburkholderia sp. BL6669N2]|uniref:alpha/beta fold hydrolase n=1 Tax=Paraburkholderia sp. BL6669N2 TaxID=1938807 RepID=UPI000E26B3FD|nr:alpha/beta hydrolase [Paraburkholderia sp. BL6669N2]REG49039.1 pimeloyl-ACP methyl ester carboxylesterase [Paraburkholderia sp. BL6669N2]